MSGSLSRASWDPDQIIEEIQKRLELLRPWSADSKRGHELVGSLTALGFFRGFSSPKLFDSIVSRLEENAADKQSLATHLLNDFKALDPTPKSIFIESGSTLAYFAKSLAEEAARHKRSLDLPPVVTNNFLVQTLLFEWCEVRVTEGALREIYLAYLPFGKERVTEETLASTERDRVAFRRIDRALSSLGLLYATASTFGFLIGPMTRTRDNAIFKYCIFNNQAHRPIKFCITEPKVFRSPRFVWDWNVESTSSVPHHLKDCLLVFDIDTASDADRHRSHASPRAIPDLPVDGVALKDTKVVRWAPGQQHGFRSAPAELALQREGYFVHNFPIVGVYDTWLNFLDGQPSGTVEIVIGCNSKDTADEVWETACEANKYLEAMRYRFKYNRHKLQPSDDPVLHLRVER